MAHKILDLKNRNVLTTQKNSRLALSWSWWEHVRSTRTRMRRALSSRSSLMRLFHKHAQNCSIVLSEQRLSHCFLWSESVHTDEDSRQQHPTQRCPTEGPSARSTSQQLCLLKRILTSFSDSFMCEASEDNRTAQSVTVLWIQNDVYHREYVAA